MSDDGVLDLDFCRIRRRGTAPHPDREMRSAFLFLNERLDELFELIEFRLQPEPTPALAPARRSEDDDHAPRSRVPTHHPSMHRVSETASIAWGPAIAMGIGFGFLVALGTQLVRACRRSLAPEAALPVPQPLPIVSLPALVRGEVQRQLDTVELVQHVHSTRVVEQVLNVPVPGPRGEQGPPGIRGRDGRDGADGRNGRDGRDGRDGADGRDGVRGRDGADGRDGFDGVDGKDGRDGRDGRRGAAGRNGRRGATARSGKVATRSAGQPERAPAVSTPTRLASTTTPDATPIEFVLRAKPSTRKAKRIAW